MLPMVTNDHSQEITIRRIRSGRGSCQMSTIHNAPRARLSIKLGVASAGKLRRKLSLQETEIAVAQNFGTRLWTSCT